MELDGLERSVTFEGVKQQRVILQRYLTRVVLNVSLNNLYEVLWLQPHHLDREKQSHFKLPELPPVTRTYAPFALNPLIHLKISKF